MAIARSSVLLTLALLVMGPVALSSSSSCGGAGAKGGGGAGGTDPCLTKDKCYNPAACSKEGPTRSYAKDVLPIFESSCVNDFSCHGNGQQPFLGPQSGMLGPGDAMAIYSGLVGKPASETMSENFVEPGKPEASFLMQKMDQALGCTTIGCKTNALGCGHAMPNNGTLLPVATRDVVRDWIKQGALNN